MVKDSYKLNLLVHGVFSDTKKENVIRKSFKNWSSKLKDFNLNAVFVSWSKNPKKIKIDKNLTILFLKDPGGLAITKYPLGNLNRHTYARQQGLNLFKSDDNFTLITRDDIQPTEILNEQILCLRKNNQIQINDSILLNFNKMLLISNLTSLSSPIFKTKINNPFHISDIFLLSKTVFLKEFYNQSINLINEDLNQASTDRNLNFFNKFDIKRKYLTPEVFLGLLVANVSGYKEYSWKQYKKFISEFSFIDINDLGIIWIRGFRVHKCIQGFFGRVKACEFYIYKNKKSELIYRLKFFLRAVFMLRLKCLYNLFLSFIK